MSGTLSSVISVVQLPPGDEKAETMMISKKIRSGGECGQVRITTLKGVHRPWLDGKG